MDGLRLVAERVNGRRIERVRIVPHWSGVGPATRGDRVTAPSGRGSSPWWGGPTWASPPWSTPWSGTKVTITSPRPNTTRSQVRGVAAPARRPGGVRRHPGAAQAPHRPGRAPERVGRRSSLDDVDVVVAMVDATGAVGPGDRMVLAQSARRVRSMARAAALRAELGRGDDDEAGLPTLLVVVNKIDRVGGDGVLAHLTAVAAAVDASIDEEAGGPPTPGRVLPGVGRHRARGSTPWSRRWWPGCPRGPATTPRRWSPTWPRRFWVAELVREQLLPPGRRTSCPTHRLPGHRVGVAPGPVRDPGRAGLAEGDRHRQGRRDAEGGGHGGAGPAAPRRLPRAASCGSRSAGSSARTPSTGSASDAGATRPSRSGVSAARRRVIRRRKASTCRRGRWCGVMGGSPGQQGAPVAAVARRGSSTATTPRSSADADEPARPLGQQGGGPGQVDGAEGAGAGPFPAGLQHRVVGPGEGDAVEGHQAEGAARGRRPPARSRGWRTGRSARSSAKASSRAGLGRSVWDSTGKGRRSAQGVDGGVAWPASW